MRYRRVRISGRIYVLCAKKNGRNLNWFVDCIKPIDLAQSSRCGVPPVEPSAFARLVQQGQCIHNVTNFYSQICIVYQRRPKWFLFHVWKKLAQLCFVFYAVPGFSPRARSRWKWSLVRIIWRIILCKSRSPNNYKLLFYCGPFVFDQLNGRIGQCVLNEKRIFW